MMEVIRTVKSQEQIGLDWTWNIYKLKDGSEACECVDFILKGSCNHISEPIDTEAVKTFRELKFKEYQGVSQRFNLQKHKLSPIPLRAYGVELEGGVANEELLKKVLNKKGLRARLTGYNGGKVNNYIAIGKDSSLHSLWGDPIEITTPKLIGWGNKRYGFRMIEIILREWNRLGLDINETCGCHVTISTSKYTYDDYRKLVLFFYLSQPFLFKIVSKSRWNNSYCYSILPSDLKYYHDYITKKYKALNVTRGHGSLLSRDERVEFRLYHGTGSVDEVRAFTLLSLAAVDVVKNNWNAVCRFFENLDYRESEGKHFSKWLDLLEFNNHPVKKLARAQLQSLMNNSEYNTFIKKEATESYRASVFEAFKALYEEVPSILNLFGNPDKIERKIKRHLKNKKNI